MDGLVGEVRRKLCGNPGLVSVGVAGVVALVMLEQRRERKGFSPVLQTQQFRCRAFSAGIATEAFFASA